MRAIARLLDGKTILLAPPIPTDEVERIAALCRLHILDTPPEERFDRITRTAQRLFGVPIALVSLPKPCVLIINCWMT